MERREEGDREKGRASKQAELKKSLNRIMQSLNLKGLFVCACGVMVGEGGGFFFVTSYVHSFFRASSCFSCT